ncbi:MAG: hypothetical protein ABJC13_02585 [Acidobacteriota bacterium]
MRSLSQTGWLALAALSLTSCLCAPLERNAKAPDAGRIEDVSSVAPDPALLRQDSPGKIVQRLPEVESVGDCAPRLKYPNESRTSCIEGRPCRGFGVQDESGRVYCTCYGETGGCVEGKRCDVRRLICVPEDEPPGL